MNICKKKKMKIEQNPLWIIKARGMWLYLPPKVHLFYLSKLVIMIWLLSFDWEYNWQENMRNPWLLDGFKVNPKVLFKEKEKINIKDFLFIMRIKSKMEEDFNTHGLWAHYKRSTNTFTWQRLFLWPLGTIECNFNGWTIENH